MYNFKHLKLQLAEWKVL